MSAVTTVPITVTPEAAAHVAGLSMQKELQSMIERAQQLIPGLQRLDVVLEPPYDTGDEMAVVIEALRDLSTYDPEDRTHREWTAWQIHTFSPDILRHFTLLVSYGLNHAR